MATSSGESDSSKRLLLFSTPRSAGERYLESSIAPIKGFLGKITELTFIPYANFDFDAYTSAVRKKLGSAAISVTSVHEVQDPKKAIETAEALFVGGGNTFQLLEKLYDSDILTAIQDRVNDGMPYIGTSAGSVVAGPTIRTWEEFAVVLPPSLDALGIVPFEIRPHYMDIPPEYTVGHPVDKRIEAFHKISDTPVVALYEGARIHVSAGEYRVDGQDGAIIFEKGEDPRRCEPGEVLIFERLNDHDTICPS